MALSDGGVSHVQVHSKSKSSDFSPYCELVSALRAAGDRLHVLAADALELSCAEVESLSERVEKLEAIGRLNGETIRKMQRAASEAASAQYRVSTQNGGFHARR